jgi:hypothetical protein
LSHRAYFRVQWFLQETACVFLKKALAYWSSQSMPIVFYEKETELYV